MSDGQDRIDFLDALRGFAILGVIVTHVGAYANVSGVARKITDFGGMGVELFFVISAFTIFLTFDRALRTETAPVRNFFIRRLFRIAPVYWLGIVLYTAIYGLASRGWKEGPELWHYFFHITLTNVMVPEATSSVVPGGWSISVEVIFYLSAPLWFLLVRGMRSATVFTLCWAIVGTGVIFTMPNLAKVDAIPDWEWRQYWFRSPFSQMACFGVGMMLYYITTDGRFTERFVPRKTWSIGLLGAAIALILWGIVAGTWLVPRHYFYSVTFLLIGLSLALVPWPWLVNGATRFMGKISYSAYLLHFLAIDLVGRWVLPVVPDFQRSIVLLLATLLITIPASYLSYSTVERTAMSAAKRLIKKLDRDMSAVAAQRRP
jgi:peptidoglycan/LPS O-acetylase OafA/YrhL